MRLVKLELNGFKSFAKKTEIIFDQGITAIVGPNGCGKSNVADAIRWVLGEQSAKTLRGARMEDVIFAGTATRKQQGYCEVTLVFDNTDGKLPIDFTEVSLTRRVFRSGESEYCINNTNCRLKDIHELLRDTGLGKEGYSIVGQGKVEEILSNKSSERRKAFEEAAGIMKYRVRKEEACRNLENTQTNLTRLSDILFEIEVRLEPLKEQSETAAEYLRLRDELKELEINLFLYQHDKIIERSKNINETIAQLKGEIAEIEEQRLITNTDCEKIEREEKEISEKLSALHSELMLMTAGVEKQLGEINILDERILNSEKEREKLLERIKQNTEHKATLSEMLSTHDGSSVEREEVLNALREERDNIQKEIVKLNIEVMEKEQAVEDLKNSIIDAMNRISDAKSNISRLNANKESLLERKDEIKNSNESYALKAIELTEELKQAQNELGELKNELENDSKALDLASKAVNECNYNLNKKNDDIKALEQTIEGMRSRINVLTEMKRAHEGYYLSIKKLMQDAERNSALSDNIEGVVAELISVPEIYENAIENSLSSALQNIVTPTEQSAKTLIHYLREKNYGRATFLPITSMRPKTLTREERNAINVDGCYGVASELIDYDPKYKNVVENLLGRTIIVSDLDVGILINKRVGQTLKIATTDGDIISPGGSMTGGSNTKKEFSLLGRERECIDLLGLLDEKRKQLNSQKVAREDIVKQLEKANLMVSECVRNRHATEIKNAQQVDKVDIISQQLDKQNEQVEHSEIELQRISDSIIDIEAQIKLGYESQEEFDSNRNITQEDVGKEQAVLNRMRNTLTQLNEKHTELKIRVVSLEKDSDSQLNEQKRLAKDLSATIAMLDIDEKAVSQLEIEKQQLIESKAQKVAELGNRKTINDDIQTQYSELEKAREAMNNTLSKYRNERESYSEALNDKREKLYKQEVAQNKCEVDLTSMQDKIWQDYELTYENALAFRRQIAVTSSHQQADELRRAIRELGDINVNAIEDYRDLSERYSTLNSQYEDLRRAEIDLMKLIEELTSTMEENFKEKFELIRENFKLVFVELFQGGSADLALANEDDVLNCDIEILAQIPGKKLQGLAPLSGGERALTAIALQFAILGLKPTAFCLLDEIDASLDESNVTRFTDYLQSYAKKTQFILITHRKGSMEACNALYGISQQEKGVSKVVSARIGNFAAEA